MNSVWVRSFPNQLSSASAPSALVVALALLTACSERPSEGPMWRQGVEARRAFASDFKKIASVTLPDTGATAVIRLSGADLFKDSLLAVTDPSEGRVVLVDLHSGGLRAFGRPGIGPGEFQVPVEPRFDSRGHLHILDPGLRRIQVFDAVTLKLRRTALLQDLMSAMYDYDLVGDSLYALAGNLIAGQGVGVVMVDTSGRVRKTIKLPIPDRPSRSEASPLWASLGRLNVYASADDLWITRPMFDSVWTAKVEADSQAVVHVPAPSFETPSLPAQTPTNRAGIVAWWGTQLLPHTVLHSATSLYVGFARGTYNDGAPGVLMVLGPDGAWRGYSDAPPVVGLSGRSLVVITSADRLPLTLEVVQERRGDPE
jgi:anti-sigma factor RsiW